MKMLLGLSMALAVAVSTPALGLGSDSQHSSESGGVFGSSASRPGTNSLGTALAGPRGNGVRKKGTLLGTGTAAIARENKRVERSVHSICRGC